MSPKANPYHTYKKNITIFSFFFNTHFRTLLFILLYPHVEICENKNTKIFIYLCSPRNSKKSKKKKNSNNDKKKKNIVDENRIKFEKDKITIIKICEGETSNIHTYGHTIFLFDSAHKGEA